MISIPAARFCPRDTRRRRVRFRPSHVDHCRLRSVWQLAPSNFPGGRTPNGALVERRLQCRLSSSRPRVLRYESCIYACYSKIMTRYDIMYIKIVVVIMTMMVSRLHRQFPKADTYSLPSITLRFVSRDYHRRRELD